MTSKREAAKALAAQGFRIFPLLPNGKTPAIARADWSKIATSDSAKVEAMWTCPVTDAELDFNVGVALDSNTLVVDVDTRDGKQGAKSLALLEALYEPLPATYEVRTASGGRHLYYAVPDSGNFPKELAQHIDLKGEGGYVVGPGSTVDGKSYCVGSDGPTVTPAPAFLAEQTRGRAPRAKDATIAAPLVELDTPDAVARAIDWLTTAAPDHGTYQVAARVKDLGISQERCLDLLMEHWPPAAGKGEEHVAFRVENAYRYGQNAPGVASAEAEFEAVDIGDRSESQSATKRRGLYFVPWDKAQPDIEQPYLIDGVMDLGAMVVTYGDSNVGKTYVKLDQCFHVAAGVDWNGCKVRKGLVVYVASEGGKGFPRRIEALRRKHGAANIPFALVPCPIDLAGEQADTNRLVRLVRDAEAHFGETCVMIVIDTLARAMAGKDENTAVDMGRLVGHCDRLRAATGATVDLIHHTGKDKAKGARGSSALRAATDTEIEVGEGVVVASKQRDLAKGGDMRFELETVEIGRRSDGKAVTACVVRWITVTEFEMKLSGTAEQMLEVLDALIAERQDEEPDNRDIRIPWAEWQLHVLSCIKTPSGKPVLKNNLYRARIELYQNGLIKKDHKNQWFR